MEKDILDGKLGDIGSYDLEFKEGKLRFVIKAGIAEFGVSAMAGVEIGAEVLIAKIFAKGKAAIPGPIDDAVFDFVQKQLMDALKA